MRLKNILPVLVLLTIPFFIQGCKKDNGNPSGDQDDGPTKTVTVGALLSLTGNWSSLGITSQAAMDIALEDINNHMKQQGAIWRFATKVYDTKLDTGLTRQFITAAKEDSIVFVVGPQSSAEAEVAAAFANDNRMLVVSQGSTAGSLSIVGDNLFRFCPADNVEGAAIAKTMYQDGVRAVITVARDDAGNRGLQTATGAAFAGYGGTEVKPITPYSVTDSDFTAIIAQIKAEIVHQTGFRNPEAVAVYYASFDECVTLFRQALMDPVLYSVRWYGGDGTALSVALQQDLPAAEFAIRTNYIAPAYGLPEATRHLWEPLSEKVIQRTGLTPDAFALAAYDALWVTALTYLQVVEPAFDALKEQFTVQANRYNGVTGNTLLNAAGDRATGAYDYWGLVSENGVYRWKVKAKSE